MGIYYTNVRTQRACGTTATTLSEDIKFDFTADKLELAVYAQKTTTSAATLLNFINKLTQIRIETTNSQPESTIDGQDLHDFLVTALYFSPYMSPTTTTDTKTVGFGLLVPLNPYPTDPTMNYGLPAGKGTQFTADWAADVALLYNTYTYNLNVSGVSADVKGNPLGYVRWIRDAFTGTLGQDRFTTISGSGFRLLGTFNFGTTSFDDLGGAAAVDVTTIRQQAVNYSSNTLYGPYRPEKYWPVQFLPEITAAPPIVMDNGTFFADYGINNRAGAPGLDISGGQVVQIKTTYGASDPARIYPTILAR